MLFIYTKYTRLIFFLKMYQGPVALSVFSIFGICFEINSLKVDISERQMKVNL